MVLVSIFISVIFKTQVVTSKIALLAKFSLFVNFSIS